MTTRTPAANFEGFSQTLNKNQAKQKAFGWVYITNRIILKNEKGGCRRLKLLFFKTTKKFVKPVLASACGAQVVFKRKKNRGQKSPDTVPLTH